MAMLAASSRERLFREGSPWLVRVALDLVDRDLCRTRCRGDRLWDERREPAPERRRPRRPGAHADSADRVADAAPVELGGQGAVGGRATTLRGVLGDGPAVAGRLGKTDAPGDDRLVDGVGEVATHLGRHLRGEVRPRVEHREDDSVDGQRRVQVIADEVDGRDELAEALERVVLALERHEHRVRRRQRIHREQAERGRAVDEDVVVRIGDRRQEPGEAPLALGDPGKLHLGPGEGDRRGDEMEARDSRCERRDRGAARRRRARRRWTVHRQRARPPGRSWHCPGGRGRSRGRERRRRQGRRRR